MCQISCKSPLLKVFANSVYHFFVLYVCYCMINRFHKNFLEYLLVEFHEGIKRHMGMRQTKGTRLRDAQKAQGHETQVVYHTHHSLRRH